MMIDVDCRFSTGSFLQEKVVRLDVTLVERILVPGEFEETTQRFLGCAATIATVVPWKRQKLPLLSTALRDGLGDETMVYK